MVELHAALLALRQQLLGLEREQAPLLDAVAGCYRASALNLLHFIAFHRHNHPGLQARLRRHALSTLAGCDPHLLASLSTLIDVVGTLLGQEQHDRPDPAAAPDFEAGHALLRDHGEALLGPCPAVVVTLPGEAAVRPELIPELLAAGMDLARINCAHDGPAVWAALARQVRQAARASGRPCRILMDLAGPKLRTGPLPAVPGVVSARVQRDRYGRLVQPAHILAVPAGSSAGRPVSPHPAVPHPAVNLVRLPVLAGEWLQLERGDRLEGRDASRRLRELVVLERLGDGLLLQCRQHCRFTSGLVFAQRGGTARMEVAALAEQPGELVLRVGDRPLLTAGPEGIPCTLPEVLAKLVPGDRVLFDDGRIAARVTAAAVVPEAPVQLEITRAKPRGSRLRADQGINVPDTPLCLPALTDNDRSILDFVSTHADLISYSFVSSEADIAALFDALGPQIGCLGIVLKIETVQAFLNLPRLLLAAMRYSAPIGVMIARGDLAIECGWEALARLQEEILRICAAAHVPCIWATQVLDSLAHDGLPTRAEITDAAMGARAEALMLNKGDNILEAVQSLRRIMRDSGIQRSDNSTAQEDQLLSCVTFANPLDRLVFTADDLAIDGGAIGARTIGP